MTVAALAALALWIALAGSPGRAPRRAEAARGERGVAQGGAPAVLDASEDAERVAARPDANEPDAARPPARSAAELAPRAQRGEPALELLRGAAIRVGADGAEHASDDGLLKLGWLHGAEWVERDVEVRGGAFAVEAPAGVLPRVAALELSGRALAVHERELVVPPDRVLVVRGFEMEPMRLHVVALEDGRALDGIDVLRPAERFAVTQHPGEPAGTFVARGAASPVALEARGLEYGTLARYYVRAPGRAFTAIDVDHSAGGERRLALPRAGSLEVRLAGNVAWLAAEVRLWPPDAGPHEAYAYAKARPDADDRARFEDLAAGAYRVALERGWADQRVAYGAALVEVRPGERTHVAIDVTPPERPVATTVAGTLLLPRAWGEERVQLALQAQGPASVWSDEEQALPVARMRRLETSEGDAADVARFAWSFDVPTPGDYELAAHPMLVRALCVVPPEGLNDVTLAVPPPADVEVRVVDVESGEEIAVDRLFWMPERIEEIAMTPLHQAVADPRTGRVTFRTPAGRIGVRPIGYALTPAHEDDETWFDVEPGLQTVDLVVRRQIEVHLRFLEGEAEVPWRYEWRIGAERVDGDARDVARGGGKLWFAEPGVYRLRANGDLAPFTAIAETVFEVAFPARGEDPPTFDVELVR